MGKRDVLIALVGLMVAFTIALGPFAFLIWMWPTPMGALAAGAWVLGLAIVLLMMTDVRIR